MGRELFAVLLLAACGSGTQSPAAQGADATPFRVEVAPASCVAGDECSAQIQLTALGEYKVNEEYPFKFVADPDLGVPVEGASFAVTGKQTGTMTVKMRPVAAGTERVTGVFKLSVCTPDKCEIEEPKVAIDLTISPVRN